MTKTPSMDGWPPADLVDSIATIEESAVLVGAGLSQGAGYVGWIDLMNELVKLCAPGHDDAYVQEMQKVAIEDCLGFASWCRGQNRQGYYELLERLFNHDSTKERFTLAHEHILQVGFNTILTTNYDSCLEQCAKEKKEHRGQYYYSDYIDYRVVKAEKGSICHIHGWAARAVDQLVLTYEDYFEAYENPHLKEIVEFAYKHRTVLFVGFSFNDPSLRQLLERVTLRFRTQRGMHRSPLHYALLPAEARESTEFRKVFFRNRYNVSAHFYEVTIDGDGNTDYSQLDNRLKELVEAVQLR